MSNMNEILRAKLEACLLLATSANGFRYNARVVCKLTKEGFHSDATCQRIYNLFDENFTNQQIYNMWCSEELFK